MPPNLQALLQWTTSPHLERVDEVLDQEEPAEFTQVAGEVFDDVVSELVHLLLRHADVHVQVLLERMSVPSLLHCTQHLVHSTT